MRLAALALLLVTGCGFDLGDLEPRTEWICACRLVWVDDGWTATHWANDEAPEEYRREPWKMCGTEDDAWDEVEAQLPDSCGCIQTTKLCGP